MRASHDTYENKGTVSCELCHHFDSNEYCRLDIYDKIVNNFNDPNFS